MRRLSLALLLVAGLLPATAAVANTSHDGWPDINGVLLMNKDDSSRPLDGRPGQDPFGGQDDSYSCDSLHLRGDCQSRFVSEDVLGGSNDRRGRGEVSASQVVTSRAGHNEL